MCIIILFATIILLITNNQIVISGASYGLMLWYKSIVPLLLPFMLISGIIEKNIIKEKSRQYLAIPSIIFLGLFCGYPIGAKATSSFVKEGTITLSTGNILLPICNNVSPMFFLGYILSNTLNNSISPTKAYAVIFLPYIITLLFEHVLITIHNTSPTNSKERKPFKKAKRSKTNSLANNSYTNRSSQNSKQCCNQSISEQSINQITMVGLYIMLCSVISEFILSINHLSNIAKLVSLGITEITRGVTYISQSEILPLNAKTALILACTSFGGISSIMQTTKVIQGSGLSLLHYTVIKLICAICTYYLCLLVI